MAILVVGSVAFDTIITPAGRREGILGGSALYFALTASKFTPVCVEAVVGEDFTDEIKGIFDGGEIDTSGIRRVEGKTFRWAGEYEADGADAKTLSIELNVFGEFAPVIPDAYKRMDNLFLANIDPDRQLSVLSQMEVKPRISTDTRDLWIESKREALGELIGKTDILFLNEWEARLYTGKKELGEVARAVLREGPEMVVIKRGASGVSLFGVGIELSAPAYPVERVVDPTGAGDSFAGGFLGYLAREKDQSPEILGKALLAGTAAASFSIEEFGVERLKEICLEDLLNRMNQLE